LPNELRLPSTIRNPTVWGTIRGLIRQRLRLRARKPSNYISGTESKRKSNYIKVAPKYSCLHGIMTWCCIHIFVPKSKDQNWLPNFLNMSFS
jgi:hypothetical protein